MFGERVSMSNSKQLCEDFHLKRGKCLLVSKNYSCYSDKRIVIFPNQEFNQIIIDKLNHTSVIVKLGCHKSTIRTIR